MIACTLFPAIDASWNANLPRFINTNPRTKREIRNRGASNDKYIIGKRSRYIFPYQSCIVVRDFIHDRTIAKHVCLRWKLLPMYLFVRCKNYSNEGKQSHGPWWQSAYHLPLLCSEGSIASRAAFDGKKRKKLSSRPNRSRGSSRRCSWDLPDSSRPTTISTKKQSTVKGILDIGRPLRGNMASWQPGVSVVSLALFPLPATFLHVLDSFHNPMTRS